MYTSEERTITIVMSPRELRDLADRMDKLWPRLTAGQTTFVDFLFHSEALKICLHLDQDYYHKRNIKRGGEL